MPSAYDAEWNDKTVRAKKKKKNNHNNNTNTNEYEIY